ncbi:MULTISPECIES: MerR family transcriptional regulator [unclassified Microbacterium]|uniref:MerR family transcriptional regulator n=2 Tax=Bacteria TaxID=2 RepID=UPI000D51FC32|nr:MerR family transcriptional regulator [Microbacterium sp. TPD7012]PVE91523.1 MerR family transcriptional regulator [Microbacterium sp. TPD7012]
MKIGELARRADVAPRLIRYYEQQGLLTAERSENGYRHYSETDAERLERAAGLVRAGIPTRLVKVLLDAEDAADRMDASCPREVASLLSTELTGLDERIACLTRSRDTIRRFLARTTDDIAEREAAG